MANKHLISLVVAGVLGLGCSVPPPRSPDAEIAQAEPPRYPDLGEYPGRSSIDVFPLYMTGTVQKVCSGPLPFFYFDSSSLQSEEKRSMDNLAQCMKTGPLKGKSILLVGHTDPRGTDDYNQKLGLERAKRVKRYLMRHGVERARVETASAGEQSARAYPGDWPADRRVDIVLAQ